ncbi:MAG: hypothetical protein U0470_13105 [Anaerolineae bacterium]
MSGTRSSFPSASLTAMTDKVADTVSGSAPAGTTVTVMYRQGGLEQRRRDACRSAAANAFRASTGSTSSGALDLNSPMAKPARCPCSWPAA